MRLERPVKRLSHWTRLMMAYIAARIQLVVKRRMKLSNFSDVGHIRKRKGTSTKTRIIEENLLKTYFQRSGISPRTEHRQLDKDLQTKNAEHDVQGMEAEDIGDAKRKTQNDADYAGPGGHSQSANARTAASSPGVIVDSRYFIRSQQRPDCVHFRNHVACRQAGQTLPTNDSKRRTTYH